MSSLFSRRPLPTQQQFQHAISRGGNAWYVACVRLTNDAELAQDALLKAWHKRQQFRGGALLETWIHRIAVNGSAHWMTKLMRKHCRNRHAPGLCKTAL